MRVLDCQSADSALKSLCTLLCMRKTQLTAALGNLSPSNFEDACNYAPARTVLWDRFVGSGKPPPIPEVVYWFHATRVPPGTDFRDGIQPLDQRLPMIKRFLKTLARELRLPSPGSSARQTDGAFQYQLKTNDRMHWGPWGFLVRDAIVQRADETHDYLKAPEIVEDLSQMIMGKKNALLLIEEFQKRTQPCIVKFRSTAPRQDVANVALSYCYHAHWGLGQSLQTNTSFDAEAQVIPFSDIVGIEYL